MPLPPLPEQRRIARRLDELMELCDELEGALARQEAERGRLTEAFFRALAERPTPSSPA